MKQTIKYIVGIYASLLLWATPALVFAQTKSNPLIDRLQKIGGFSGYQTDQNIASTPIIIGILLKAFLSFLGITFVVLMVIAGYNWMTAQGSEEVITKSKQTIRAALIGTVVAISGWAIWNFVFTNIIARPQ
jgi:RsiW-degrading membrane proteinase PrsW (M82 family)